MIFSLKKILSLLFLLETVFIFYCSSPFSSSTNLGKDVLNSVDSSITMIEKAYKKVEKNLFVAFDTSIKFGLDDKSYYYSASDSQKYPIESGINIGAFTVGNTSTDYSVAYAEFHTGVLRTKNEAERKSLDSACQIDSIYIKIRYTPNLKIEQRIRNVSFYSCPVKLHGSLSNSNGVFIKTIEVQKDSSDTIAKIELDTSIYSSLIKTSVKDSSIAPVDTQVFAFYAIAKDSGNVIRFATPVLVIRYKTNCNDTSLKTVYLQSTYTDFSVFEKDSSLAARSHQSSMENALFTKIAIDFSSLWSEIMYIDTYKVVHQASLIINTDTSVFEPECDSLYVLAGISNKNFTTKGETFAFRDSLNRLIQSSKLKVIKVVREPSQISVPIHYFLQQIIEEKDKQDLLYLYLFSLGPFWGRIKWMPMDSVKINAFFSNP
jgi:hypothetical protein